MRRRSKYDPLRDYLTRSRQVELALTLGEIEDILGFVLCRSAETPQFWANIKGTTQHTQFRAWRDAGYDAFLSSSRDVVRFIQVASDRRLASG